MAAVKPETRNQKSERTPLARAVLLLVSGFWFLVYSCAQHRDTREPLEFWALGAEGERVAALIPEFERRNPSIHVVVQQIPWSAAHEKLLTAFVGEATPDIAQMGNTWIPELVAVRALEELRGFDGRDHFPGIW